jgi:hypothetical protein
MNQEKPLIRLYRTRTFGEKMSDTFDFVRENWRSMLKFLTYLLLPVSLVQTYAMGNFMTNQMSLSSAIGQSNMDAILPWLSSMGVTMLFYFVAMVLVDALTYTMMQLYEQRQNRLQGITFAELSPGIKQKCVRQIVLLVSGFVLLIVVGLVASPSVLLGPVAMIPVGLLLFLALPLIFLVQPIYLFERISVIKAYAKSIRLGWKTWAGVVAVFTVLYIIVTIVESVVSMPWYIMVTLKNVLATQNSEPAFVSSFGYSALQYLLGVVSNFCGSLLMALLSIGMAYQYGHACDKVDGVTVDRDIENFETLNVEGLKD